MEPTNENESMPIDVKNCQRCGVDHDGMVFSPLTNPVDGFSFWAMCPTLSQPVMLQIVEVPNVIPCGRGIDWENPWDKDEASKLSTPTTGDPEKDRQILERFARNDAAIKNGDCPNGCGELNVCETVGAQSCPICGFVHSTSTINVG